MNIELHKDRLRCVYRPCTRARLVSARLAEFIDMSFDLIHRPLGNLLQPFDILTLTRFHAAKYGL